MTEDDRRLWRSPTPWGHQSEVAQDVLLEDT